MASYLRATIGGDQLRDFLATTLINIRATAMKYTARWQVHWRWHFPLQPNVIGPVVFQLGDSRKQRLGVWVPWFRKQGLGIRQLTYPP